MAREITNGTRRYADDMLEEIQNTLEKAIKANNQALEDTLKVIEENRKELK